MSGHTDAQALATLAESNFAAVCSRDPAKASAFVHRYGVVAYTDLEAMLHSPAVQMVSICAPQHTHPRLAAACARAGKIDVMTHYHKLQIQDFLQAIIEGQEPSMSGREGRKHVEIFTAIYRSQPDRRPVRFPPDAVAESVGFDRRLA